MGHRCTAVGKRPDGAGKHLAQHFVALTCGTPVKHFSVFQAEFTVTTVILLPTKVSTRRNKRVARFWSAVVYFVVGISVSPQRVMLQAR